MAGPGESDQSQQATTTTSPPSHLSLVRPVYLAGIFQLAMALCIGVVGMFASSRNCALSITWIYFFNSIWFIVSSSIGLSPTRRGAVSYGMKQIKRTMKWYRFMCVVGLFMIFGSMAVELIGVLREPEPEDGQVWNCITMHLVILAICSVALLVTMGGIAASTRLIIVFTRMQRQGVEDHFSEEPNTVSGSLGQTNHGMTSDLFILPEYSLDADLPPSYADVISGKADGLQPEEGGNTDGGANTSNS